MAALSTGERLEPVVQPALRSRWQADAAIWHRGAGPAPGDYAVALFGTWVDSGWGDTQTYPARLVSSQLRRNGGEAMATNC